MKMAGQRDHLWGQSLVAYYGSYKADNDSKADIHVLDLKGGSTVIGLSFAMNQTELSFPEITRHHYGHGMIERKWNAEK